MKNWDAYEAKIKDIGDIDFAKVDGTILPCEYIKIMWLYSEAAPILTKEEKTFVDTLTSDYSYIGRDQNGALLLFDNKPERLNINWSNGIDNINKNHSARRCVSLDRSKFDFISWDGEPWSVKDLKKLKVKE